VVGFRCDPITPPHLVIAELADTSLTFKPVFPATPMPDLTWKEFIITPEDSSFPYTAFLVRPADIKDGPLIVWPHGGPHSLLTTTFNKTALFFNKLGFSLLFVNYRGSTGHGDENVNALLGNVGDMDVKDVHNARARCLAEVPGLDGNKVFLMGGSHGGFLVTHLAGQYPGSYQGVVARNPVTNIATMAEVTDIPDWTFNEAGLDYTWMHGNPAVYQTMWTRSPISHIENITAPIFLMIGKNDLRVPPSQGIQFYHTLKALGADVRMNVYDDNHPLAKPNHDADVMIHAASFFMGAQA
jgi:acylaminoacyl-peptidase